MMAMVKENQAKVVKKEEPEKSLLEQIKENIPHLKDLIAKVCLYEGRKIFSVFLNWDNTIHYCCHLSLL